MNTNSLNLTELFECLSYLPVDISIMLRGAAGIGKSSVIAQWANYLGLPLIDRRLGQLTEGDIMGLPKLDDDVTLWKPPAWLKRAADVPSVLFLDEMNRATREVQQCAFQLVLDRKLGDLVLHPETRVVAAVNIGKIYQVNSIDPALLDRFWVADIVIDPKEWAAYEMSLGTPKWFVDHVVSGGVGRLAPDLDNTPSIKATPRSWSRVARFIRESLHVKGQKVFNNIIRGLIGPVETSALLPVLQRGALIPNVDTCLANDKKSEVADWISNTPTPQISMWVQNLAKFLVANKKNGLTKDEVKNLKLILESESIRGDTLTVFFMQILSGGKDAIKLTCDIRDAGINALVSSGIANA